MLLNKFSQKHKNTSAIAKLPPLMKTNYVFF